MPKWKTRDGRVLDIREMETAHLRSAIGMLRRNGYVTREELCDAMCTASGLGGEFAQMAAEQEITSMKLHATMEALSEELERRNRATARHRRAGAATRAHA